MSNSGSVSNYYVGYIEDVLSSYLTGEELDNAIEDIVGVMVDYHDDIILEETV